MKYTTLLINLDKSVDRLNRCTSLFAEHNIDFQRIPAILGADLTEREIKQVYRPMNSGAYHKILNPGEVGCYLSHRRAWQYIIDQDLDFAIILEDDFIYLGHSFDTLISAIKAIPQPWYYVKLADVRKSRRKVFSYPHSGFELCVYRKAPSRTCAQVVSREGAKRLLKNSQSFSRPVDVDIQHWWEKEIVIHGLLPYPFQPNTADTSEIRAMGDRKRAPKSHWKRLVNLYNLNMRSLREARKIELPRPSKSKRES